MKTNKISISSAIVAMAFAADNALAGAGLGGLSKAQSTAESVKDGLFALLGVFALIYLIYLAIMCFAEKKAWSDFGMGVVYVSIAGGTVALGSWAWSLFA